MDTLTCVPVQTVIGVLALVLPGVSALEDIDPVIASGTVACFMLLIVIAALVYGMTADSWVKSTKKSKGKVKMPRSYFIKKKEAKRRLLMESIKSSRATQESFMSKQSVEIPKPVVAVNGHVPPVVPVADKESMVKGWSQDTRKIYEEKGYTMELGDEEDDEFFIETTIVDNEVLDVGPYQSLASTTAKPVEGNVYSNPYLYSNNDRVTMTKSSDSTGGVVASLTNEMSEVSSNSHNGGPSTGPEVDIEQRLIRL